MFISTAEGAIHRSEILGEQVDAGELHPSESRELEDRCEEMYEHKAHVVYVGRTWRVRVNIS